MQYKIVNTSTNTRNSYVPLDGYGMFEKGTFLVYSAVRQGVLNAVKCSNII